MKQLNVLIDDTQYEFLRTYAFDRRQKMANVVRDLLGSLQPGNCSAFPAADTHEDAKQ